MLSGRHGVDGIGVLRVAKCASQSGLRCHDPGGAKMHSCMASRTILDEAAHSHSYESVGTHGMLGLQWLNGNLLSWRLLWNLWNTN